MLTAAVHTKALWYLTRGTGLVTLLLLTVSVVLGVAETVALGDPPLAPLRHRRRCTATSRSS